MLSVGSLFSGIGGFDLGLERAGMQVKWQVEIEEYCNRVLAKHWPNVKRYGDIKAVDWSEVEPVDLVCGGFPCQDLSLAGKRAGLSGERSGLWSEYVRCIRQVKPQWVLVENVPGLLSADDGGAFGTVLRDLAAYGYYAEWDCIPAAAVGAPHIRDRIWLLAYTNSQRQRQSPLQTNASRDKGATWLGVKERGNGCCERQAASPMADAEGVNGPWPLSEGNRTRRSEATLGNGSCLLSDADRESLGRLAESRGQCGQWAAEPAVGRVANGIPHRVDRLRGLGNAVVPQVVEWLGKRIIEYAGI